MPNQIDQLRISKGGYLLLDGAGDERGKLV